MKELSQLILMGVIGYGIYMIATQEEAKKVESLTEPEFIGPPVAQ